MNPPLVCRRGAARWRWWMPAADSGGDGRGDRLHPVQRPVHRADPQLRLSGGLRGDRPAAGALVRVLHRPALADPVHPRRPRVLALAVVFAVVRVRRRYGDMSFQFVFVWQPPPDAALPRLADSTLQTGRDATVRPGDFPQFLGPDRDATVHGVYLDRDWAAHPPRQVWRQTGSAPAGVPSPWPAIWSSRRSSAATRAGRRPRPRHGRRGLVARQRRPFQPNGMGGDGPRATPTIAGGKVFALGGHRHSRLSRRPHRQAPLDARHAQGKRRSQSAMGQKLFAARDRRSRPGGG